MGFSDDIGLLAASVDQQVGRNQYGPSVAGLGLEGIAGVINAARLKSWVAGTELPDKSLDVQKLGTQLNQLNYAQNKATGQYSQDLVSQNVAAAHNSLGMTEEDNLNIVRKLALNQINDPQQRGVCSNFAALTQIAGQYASNTKDGGFEIHRVPEDENQTHALGLVDLNNGTSFINNNKGHMVVPTGTPTSQLWPELGDMVARAKTYGSGSQSTFDPQQKQSNRSWSGQ